MNPTLFALYRASKRGKETVRLLDPEPSQPYVTIGSLLWRVKEWGCAIEPSTDPYELIEQNLHGTSPWGADLCRSSLAGFLASLRLVESSLDEDGNVHLDQSSVVATAEDLNTKPLLMQWLSLYLYHQEPFLKPLLLPPATIRRHCDAIGMFTPEPTGDTALDYFDLCRAIADFQQDYGLTDSEACACVYDYAHLLLDEPPYRKMREEGWPSYAARADEYHIQSR